MATQREIKFRQWNKHGRKYIHWGFVDGGFSGPPTSNGLWLDSPSEQYTGLKDKNGVEIYEGDLVAGLWYDADYVPLKRINYGVVEFGPDEDKYLPFPRFHLKELGEGVRDWRDMAPRYLEVIGNIWQNPDLLAPTNKPSGERE